eukprot:CAMPEP_0181317826 /NCGR_PEP_ID=MMETSP1101-20121128/16677_1 /TAXON_ID=46948 /ORGANISM="Rhodomonas abbreviata, Strain Caron Lab Isolate" /LENGTH=228 /DNA_ID=CAMNT_0023425249 /DNA_START=64 /DNA_END=750 /DNA_ORIENTATION=+
MRIKSHIEMLHGIFLCGRCNSQGLLVVLVILCSVESRADQAPLPQRDALNGLQAGKCYLNLGLRGGSAVEAPARMENELLMQTRQFVEFEDLTDSDHEAPVKLPAGDNDLEYHRVGSASRIPAKMSWCSRSADVSNDDIHKDMERHEKAAAEQKKDSREKIFTRAQPRFLCAVCEISIAGEQWYMSGNCKHCSPKCAQVTANRYIQYLEERHEILEGDSPSMLFATLD